MTRKVVFEFLKRVKEDPALLAALQSSDREGFIRNARKTGLVVSIDQLREALLEMKAGRTIELSDDDLAVVAGGAGGPDPGDLFGLGNDLLSLLVPK